MNERVKHSGGGIVRRIKQAAWGREVDDLRARVEELEAEVQECRKLNLRIAELTDVVTELLVPVVQQDPERAQALLADYTKSLG
ncbi:DUF6752 domain-containing protein [Nocardioides massiliensis]|uniref:DUF6752 domain-containing protein n=1 Tax=Nocardioides massiliensis TaxID=1325935 RepID=A0ABT9NV10_9ACTN|nr:DUF6752 domain-containing protein [Nocardioides massiliensis]MDP9824146.1 hypothetical protein [Nocardioides massiliensis]